MGDPFGRWSSSPSRSEYEDRTPLRHSNSFVRLTGKSIYNQRKDYGQTLLKLQNDFQHHVEHLLTMPLERELRSAEDCLGRLRELEEQGRVWGQDVILEVKDQELVLSDVESKEELEAFPLGSVQGCSAGLDNAVLAISVQERNPPRTSVLLFQCERLGAETLRSSLEKVLRQTKEEQSNHYGHSPPEPPPYAAPERWAEPPEPDPHPPPRRGPLSSDYPVTLGMSPGAPELPQVSRGRAPGQAVPEAERDVEILNHVLGDLERFVGRLKTALSSASTKKKLKKPALPPKDEYTDFFQKVKYALNLLGRSHRYVTEPEPPELLRLIFSALSFVLGHCPSPGLAPAVQSPLLLPEALQLLEETLGDEDYGVWKSLGTAWNKSRAEYPNSERVPAYTPVFSDGWLPPVMEQERRGSLQDTPARASVSPAQSRPSPSLRPAQAAGTGWRGHPGQESALPAQGLVRALYDFQARNSQELSVRKGDTLQVLDQQRKWWLVQDERGDRGHVPGNILEPLPEPGHSSRQVGDPSALPSPRPHQDGVAGGTAMSPPNVPSRCPPLQDSPPTLHPSSSPAEVTAWLMDKGFSRITVRTLGVLRGHELLQMSPAELRGVCPEEWRRVLFKLSPIRTSLGIGPRD
ncbi:epidermal growth factor receptor kinase substrate 8-like protein 3 [Camarhynchus parvulus]|uniref:epidermal growth factor receptor kinase substrate 8-like protein 3 n=1 Tax=Geospiza parvula TaxID=87175 RepID=UPI001237BAC6|nr:epidermal growth factor receptor kinase substrate 8-like protein 3 [Camarhynchus parvulus]